MQYLLDFYTQFTAWHQENPYLAQFVWFAIILSGGFILHKALISLALRLLTKIIRNSKTQLDDILIEDRALHRFSYLIPVLFLQAFRYLYPAVAGFVEKGGNILAVLIVLSTLAALFRGFNKYYERLPVSKERPIKGYLQVLFIILVTFGIIIIIGLLTGQSPVVLLSGLGALTAVLLLIFKDTILALVASIQINSYDLVHVGDWIEMPQYNADGDVIDIALHAIKVQNFDKTISVIPTHKLIDGAFKNWRGMTQSGSRRIKRSIYIDINSISFCDQSMLKKFRQFQLLKPYLDEKLEAISAFNSQIPESEQNNSNTRRLTNIGTFRAYAELYLHSLPKIHKDMSIMVRQLSSGPEGIPIEIYTFTSDIQWKNYEDIQSDIFDHLLAILPEFGLRVFQKPTGLDLKQINIK